MTTSIVATIEVTSAIASVMAPTKRRKRVSPPARRQPIERASKSAARQRGLTRERGESYSPFAQRPSRNRFEHYPPPPDDDAATLNPPDDDSSDSVGSTGVSNQENPSAEELDGSSNPASQMHDDHAREEDIPAPDNADAVDAAEVAPGGDVVPDDAQDETEDGDVVFDGVDGELVAVANVAQRPLEGVVVRDAQPDGPDDEEVVFDGVDADLRQREINNLENDVLEVFNRLDNVGAADPPLPGAFVEQDDGQDDISFAMAQSQASYSDESYKPDLDDASESKDIPETPTVTGADDSQELLTDNADDNPTTDDAEDNSVKDDSKVVDATDKNHPLTTNASFDSDDSSCQRIDGGPTQTPPFVIDWVEANSISEVSEPEEVPAFGDCGYDSSNRALIQLRERYPQSFNSESFTLLRKSWSG